MARWELFCGLGAIFFGSAVGAVLQPPEPQPTAVQEVAPLPPGCVRMTLEVGHVDGLEAAKKSIEAKLEQLKKTHAIVTCEMDEDEQFETATAHVILRKK